MIMPEGEDKGSRRSHLAFGIGDGLPLDFQQTRSSLPLFGFEGLLLARPGILQTKRLAAAVEVESLFHNFAL